MTRKFMGLCVAAAFGMVASLGAQSTATSSTATTSGSAMNDHNKAGEVTVTGCLMKGTDGNYVLTNARLGSEPGSTAGTSGAYHGATGTTAGTSGTAAGTATGTTTGGTASGTYESGRSSSMESGRTWELTGGKDLDKHVGHTITVTGRAEAASRERENESGTAGTTAGAMTGTTAGTAGSTATTGSTAGATGTTAQTGTTALSGSRHEMKDNVSSVHRLDVKSVKMVSTSCS